MFLCFFLCAKESKNMARLCLAMVLMEDGRGTLQKRVLGFYPINIFHPLHHPIPHIPNSIQA